MAETYTTNKLLELIGTGDLSGTWGSTLNTNVFTPIDLMLGGTASVNCAGNSNITLSGTQAQNKIQLLTGILTGNIEYIFPATGCAGGSLLHIQIGRNVSDTFTGTAALVAYRLTGRKTGE